MGGDLNHFSLIKTSPKFVINLYYNKFGASIVFFKEKETIIGLYIYFSFIINSH